MYIYGNIKSRQKLKKTKAEIRAAKTVKLTMVKLPEGQRGKKRKASKKRSRGKRL
jgi:hypothetical protein